MKKLMSLFSIIALCNYVQAQSGWNILSPFPTNNTLSGVSFIDNNNGWLAGGTDILYKTSDGGNAWSTQNTIAEKKWAYVQFTDLQHGWVLAYNGEIAATTDGGNTWEIQAPNTTSYYYNAMQFSDNQHGWALMEYDSILYTTNGGILWNRKKINSAEYLYGMKFISNTEGWICGTTGQVLHSTDGGINWTIQNSGVTGDLYAIDFIDNMQGWAVGANNSNNGIVLHTANGGTSWTTLVQNFPEVFYAVHFSDALNAIALSYYSVYRTTNGGVNWTSVYDSQGEDLFAINLLSSGNGYLVGGSGLILKTVDNGNAWTQINRTATHGNTINAIDFPDERYGWVLSNGLYHTSDSGYIWSNQTPFASSFTAKAMDFVNATKGWLVGESTGTSSGQILQTTNGGANFNFQLNSGLFPFFSVSFHDSLHGIAGTSNRMIYYTSNGGSVWDTSSIPGAANTSVKYLQLIDDETGYAVSYTTYKTFLARTNNSGQNWTVVRKDTTQFTSAYTAISFVDAQHGYVAAFDFYDTPNKFSLLRTDDGGNSWTPVYFPSSLPIAIANTQINSLQFTDMLHGWAAGGGTLSFIFYTSDGGITWSMQEQGTSVSWYSMDFVNDETGFAAGWKGDIVRTRNGGLVGIGAPSDKMNTEINIYPNPANDRLIIEYSKVVPTGACVAQIFSLSGRLLLTKSIFQQKNDLDISALSNGIYILKIISENSKPGNYKVIVLK